jgi:isopenicillin-N epimerase
MILPSPSPLAHHWSLDPDLVFLNHGSFGATPNYVLEKQRGYIQQLESSPVEFSVRSMYPLYYASKKALAQFVGTSEHNMYFVPNTTVGVNHVLHNIHESGKSWLSTNHAYGACAHALEQIAKLKNCQVIKAEIPYPIADEATILERIESAILPHTTIALIDYITSASAIIFPIKEIIKLLHAKNIEVIVDAAHAPGMVDFNLDALDADYFIANCHKWICSPKGSAFVYVHPRHQSKFKPIYYGFFNDWDTTDDRHWSNQFIWEGTRDYSPYLAVKDSLEFMPTLIDGGWTAIKKHNRELALAAAHLIADKLSVPLPAPASMLGSIINIPIPNDRIPDVKFNYYTSIKNELFHTYKIEIPSMLFPAPTQYLRISAQLYNSMEQYAYLADSLGKMI